MIYKNYIFSVLFFFSLGKIPVTAQVRNGIFIDIKDDVIKPNLKPTLFGINFIFHGAGVYYGTLTNKDGRNQRKKLAEALHAGGIKLLRFPGGTPTHYYLYENVNATKQLKQAIKHPGLINRGYDENIFFRKFYTSYVDFLSFCKEYNFESMLSVNTSFYVDNNQIHAITKNKLANNTNYYNGNKITEATKNLSNLVDSILQKGFHVKYWELGNEDFLYMDVDDYISVIVAFSGVIKRKIPDAKIFVNGEGWISELLNGLKKQNGLELIDFVTYHYPFGKSLTADKKYSLKDWDSFAAEDVDFPKRINEIIKDEIQGGNRTHIRLAITETSIFKYNSRWDPNLVNWMPAHAIKYAFNWIDLIKNPDVDFAIFHDFESSFFGMFKYGVEFNFQKKQFEYVDKNKLDTNLLSLKNKFYSLDSFYLTPTARINKILSEYTGMDILSSKILSNQNINNNRTINVLAGKKNNKVIITTVNNTNYEQKIIFRLEQFKNGYDANSLKSSYISYKEVSLFEKLQHLQENIQDITTDNNEIITNIPGNCLLQVSFKVRY